MGYADGFYYGQGRIICDTSTFSVGDTIRVRSMTDSSKVWNQQVATVGTALVFTVPCYDYYKICAVQTIGGVATEVGGVYKTIDYGQTLFINVLDKTTLGGIQAILNAHQETSILNIGDEVNVTENGSSVPYLVTHINGYDNHEVILSRKEIKTLETWGDNYGVDCKYTDSSIRTFCGSLYNLIEEKFYIKKLLKASQYATNYSQFFEQFEDYIWVPNIKEVSGVGVGNEPIQQIHFSLFTTQSSRIKTHQGTSARWWTCDGAKGVTNRSSYVIETDGSTTYAVVTNNFGVLPCFRLTADS